MEMCERSWLEMNCWDVERREDGAVVVRVRSQQSDGQQLPDAIFAFRAGEPQYGYWEQLLLARDSSAV